MDYFSVVKEVVLHAGKVHRKYFQRNFTVKAKGKSYDLLTIADTEAEEVMVSFIRKHFPKHNFLCEENIYRKNNSEFTWVIDPLDGTNNFASGLPIFCASAALVYRNEILVSAVYDTTRDELFSAQKGEGAWLNKKRIYVNKAKELKEALLITGFYYSRGKEMVETLETIKRFHFAKIIGIRRLGAAALDLCYVASGRAAGFWEFELNPWDYMGGKLIVEEAGGRVTGKYGEDIPLKKKYFVVASNGLIHQTILAIINKD
ncbi:MAG: inositol monophosphatase [Candidatus Omnitrophica bacterium]|nr:inositol monophosphatase [Candidatus Omnitrophota bacterium]